MRSGTKLPGGWLANVARRLFIVLGSLACTWVCSLMIAAALWHAAERRWLPDGIASLMIQARTAGMADEVTAIVWLLLLSGSVALVAVFTAGRSDVDGYRLLARSVLVSLAFSTIALASLFVGPA